MHRVMIQPASYDNCAEAVDRAFERFPLEMAGKKGNDKAQPAAVLVSR